MSICRIIAPLSLQPFCSPSEEWAYGLRFRDGRELARPVGYEECYLECTRIILAFSSCRHKLGQSLNYLGRWRQVGTTFQLRLERPNSRADAADVKCVFDVEWMDDKALCDMFPALRPFLFPASSTESQDETTDTEQ